MDLKTELEQTVRMIGLLAASDTGNELCRRLATDEVFGAGTVGTQIYALTNAGRWQSLGSYGKNGFGNQNLSQFDENLLTLAARSKGVEVGTLEVDGVELDAVAVALLRDSVPVGALLRLSTPGAYAFVPTNGSLRAVQDSGGLFLESIGYQSVARSAEPKEASPEDLTERQHAILIEMAHGKTNLVIANEMILSESTIKQESVKIFRALGVGTRQQAVLKARTLGLLPDGMELMI
ncbi:MAG: LuxR C-terminal-related transcriptional regulator [Aquiluna sp.]|nr:LuxR C-terminal-related transcriptional regulator [Aquiluna sp.]